MIPYGKQSISEEDINAVVKVLRSDFLTQGPIVPKFENDLANYCGAKFAKVVSNGTAALHLAYLAIGLKQNDIVWTSPNTFVATANAALYCGAIVDFVDIDAKTYNISIDCLKEKLKQAKKENNLPKLVVPVHFSGQSCEMKDIWMLSKEYGFKVIEDASHALGGEYLDNKVGSCKYSDMAVFSFHPVKMITTAEGGAILTNDMALDNKVALLRSHGITKDKVQFKNESDGDWYYEQQALGFNYRLNDMQAALGVSQLQRLDSFVEKRQEIANYYLSKLKDVTLPYQHSDTNTSWHLFVIQVEDRNIVYQELKKQGIMAQIHYIPLYKQPFFNRKKFKKSNDYYKNCLSLPIYADLSIKNQDHVIKVLEGRKVS
jgi:UDP-4-amino-4,6-dideoxy-N-acetyl-beta-L-altrosamine transaminase